MDTERLLRMFLLSHISTVASHRCLSGKSSRVVAITTDYTAAKLSPFLILLQETRLIILHKSALHVKRRFTIYEADNVSSRIVTEKSEQAPPEELRLSFNAITGTC